MSYVMMKGNGQKMYITHDEYWQKEWGNELLMQKFFFQGGRVDPAFLPKSGYVVNGETDLVPLIAYPFWLCTDDVKETIEQIEPDTHHFYPFTLRDKKQGEVIAHYHLINLCRSIEAIDLVRCDPHVLRFLSNKQQDGSLLGQLDPWQMRLRPNQIAVKKSAIQGAHLWVDKVCAESDKPFISDALYDALRPFAQSNYLAFYHAREVGIV